MFKKISEYFIIGSVAIILLFLVFALFVAIGSVGETAFIFCLIHATEILYTIGALIVITLIGYILKKLFKIEIY